MSKGINCDIVVSSNSSRSIIFICGINKNPLILFAHSAGAVEYTDCTPAEDYLPRPRVFWIWH